MSYSVVFENVTKKYKMYKSSSERLKGVVAPNRSGEDFYAIKNISFKAKPGDVIGIVGVNGAGKSTLSNILAGVAPETSGNITINGKVAVISVSSGLDGQLTGRDNIEYKCLMLGFSKKEIDEMMPDIIDFADIGKFIDQPVKNYSSGMKSRLGFAIAISIDPDILVIDEALSVGDQTFKEKSFAKMNEFKEKGKTIFFVSHALNQVRDFCNKVLWLEAGEVRGYGDRPKILPKYRKFLRAFNALSPEEQKAFRNEVAERRSRLDLLDETDHDNNEIPSFIPKKDSHLRTQSRNKMRSLNRNMMVFVVLLLALSIALVVVKPWNLIGQTLFEEEPLPVESDGNTAGGAVGMEEDTDVSADLEGEFREEQEKDTRYVAVESAIIRETPDLEGEIIAFANFGETYNIQNVESPQDSEDIEWLQLSPSATEEDGWISGNVMRERLNALEDAEVAHSLLELTGYDPVLNEISNGNRLVLEEPAFVSHPYIMESHITETLGEPELRIDTALIYHGEIYDYMITVEEDVVLDITVTEMIE